MSENSLSKDRMDKINAGFAAYLEILKESGGSMSKMIIHGSDGPAAALIVVCGDDATKEIVDALEGIEDSW